MASMEMFFSDSSAFDDASIAEATNRLKRMERVNKVTWSLSIFCNSSIVLVALQGAGRLLWIRPGFRSYTDFDLPSQLVIDRRTGLYNRLVASYHKAKVERADMARELEVAQGKAFSLVLLYFASLV
jgi:hypothetical protein